MRIYQNAGTAIAAEFMFSLLIIEVVPFDRVLASQIHKILPRRVCKDVSVPRADAAVAHVGFVLVKRWEENFELDCCTMAIAIIPSNEIMLPG